MVLGVWESRKKLMLFAADRSERAESSSSPGEQMLVPTHFTLSTHTHDAAVFWGPRL